MGENVVVPSLVHNDSRWARDQEGYYTAIEMRRDVLLEVVTEFADELNDADMLRVRIHVTPARMLNFVGWGRRAPTR